MAHSFVAYIDESGDDGLSGSYRVPGRGGGSSHWLSLGATVWRQSRDLDAVQWAKAISAQMPRQKQSTPLHFARLDHAQRIMAIAGIFGKPMRTVAVIAYKPSLQAATFTEKNQLYNYLARYLIERLSWLCRDTRKQVPEGDGKVKVTFARRGGMNYPNFRAYLSMLKEKNDPDIQIHWPVIDIEAIEALDQSESRGLQIADLAISGLTTALEPDFYGNSESRFAQMLKSNIYNRNGNFYSYGAKMIPPFDRIAPTQCLTEFDRIFGNVRRPPGP